MSWTLSEQTRSAVEQMYRDHDAGTMTEAQHKRVVSLVRSDVERICAEFGTSGYACQEATEYLRRIQEYGLRSTETSVVHWLIGGAALLVLVALLAFGGKK